MGLVEGKADAGQMESMRAIIREAMRSGASAMTTGLIYPPGSVTGEEELTDVCRTVAECGGHYCTHMRDEGDSIVSSVEGGAAHGEKFRRAARHLAPQDYRAAQFWPLGTHAGHGRRGQRERDGRLLRPVSLRRGGHQPHGGPCPRSSPSTAQKLIKDLADRGFRPRVLEAIDRGESESEILMRSAGGPENVVVSNAEGMPELTGKTLARPDASWARPLRRHVRDSDTHQRKRHGHLLLHERGGRNAHHAPPAHHVRSDASRASVSNYFGHPRAFGTFSTILTKYVRENKVMPLREMVRKACHLPALVNNLPGKGLIKPGYDATSPYSTTKI